MKHLYFARTEKTGWPQKKKKKAAEKEMVNFIFTSSIHRVFRMVSYYYILPFFCSHRLTSWTTATVAPSIAYLDWHWFIRTFTLGTASIWGSSAFLFALRLKLNNRCWGKKKWPRKWRCWNVQSVRMSNSFPTLGGLAGCLDRKLTN